MRYELSSFGGSCGSKWAAPLPFVDDVRLKVVISFAIGAHTAGIELGTQVDFATPSRPPVGGVRSAAADVVLSDVSSRCMHGTSLYVRPQ